MNTLKQNIARTAAILLVLTQLAGCFAGTGAESNNNNTAFDNEITDIENDNTIVSEAITFNWVAPVSREDESPIAMSEIAGYRIYFGTETGDYTRSIEVNDAYIDAVTFDELDTASTYYIVITTIDTDGRESAYSEEIIVNV